MALSVFLFLVGDGDTSTKLVDLKQVVASLEHVKSTGKLDKTKFEISNQEKPFSNIEG
jgi:hypothetical protein